MNNQRRNTAERNALLAVYRGEFVSDAEAQAYLADTKEKRDAFLASKGSLMPELEPVND